MSAPIDKSFSLFKLITKEFPDNVFGESLAVNRGHVFWGFVSGEIQSCNTVDNPCKPYMYENGSMISMYHHLTSVIIYTPLPNVTTDEVGDFTLAIPKYTYLLIHNLNTKYVD